MYPSRNDNTFYGSGRLRSPNGQHLCAIHAVWIRHHHNCNWFIVARMRNESPTIPSLRPWAHTPMLVRSVHRVRANCRVRYVMVYHKEFNYCLQAWCKYALLVTRRIPIWQKVRVVAVHWAVLMIGIRHHWTISLNLVRMSRQLLFDSRYVWLLLRTICNYRTYLWVVTAVYVCRINEIWRVLREV